MGLRVQMQVENSVHLGEVQGNILGSTGELETKYKYSCWDRESNLGLIGVKQWDYSYTTCFPDKFDSSIFWQKFYPLFFLPQCTESLYHQQLSHGAAKRRNPGHSVLSSTSLYYNRHGNHQNINAAVPTTWSIRICGNYDQTAVLWETIGGGAGGRRQERQEKERMRKNFRCVCRRNIHFAVPWLFS